MLATVPKMRVTATTTRRLRWDCACDILGLGNLIIIIRERESERERGREMRANEGILGRAERGL